MSGSPARAYLTVALAVVVAGVLVSASLLAAGSARTVTKTDVVDVSPSAQVSVVVTTVTQTTTLFITSVSTETTASYVPLQLRVSLNATGVAQGGAVLAQVSVFNPLPENVSVVPVYAPNSTIADWNDYDFLCGSSVWSIFGYGLFSGHYTSDNISSAGNPLMLAPPVGLPCVQNGTPDSLTFLPNSSSVAAGFGAQSMLGSASLNASSYECEAASSNSAECPVGDALTGYWNTTGLNGELDPDTATFQSPYFHYFSPGGYTLAVEDMWGQVSYSYFQVQ